MPRFPLTEEMHTVLTPKEAVPAQVVLSATGWFNKLSGNIGSQVFSFLCLHAGSGGRIAIQTNGSLLLGTVDLSGYRPGTLHISGATATSSLDFSSAHSPLILLTGTGTTHQGFMVLEFQNRKMMVGFNIKPVPSLLMQSIWHPD